VCVCVCVIRIRLLLIRTSRGLAAEFLARVLFLFRPASMLDTEEGRGVVVIMGEWWSGGAGGVVFGGRGEIFHRVQSLSWSLGGGGGEGGESSMKDPKRHARLAVAWRRRRFCSLIVPARVFYAAAHAGPVRVVVADGCRSAFVSGPLPREMPDFSTGR
jgi:hypothetical protein